MRSSTTLTVQGRRGPRAGWEMARPAGRCPGGPACPFSDTRARCLHSTRLPTTHAGSGYALRPSIHQAPRAGVSESPRVPTCCSRTVRVDTTPRVTLSAEFSDRNTETDRTASPAPGPPSAATKRQRARESRYVASGKHRNNGTQVSGEAL